MSIFTDRLKYGKETVKDPLYDNPFSFGKIIINQNQCNLCQNCLVSCPAGAFSFHEGKLSIDGKKCLYCGNCLDVCEHHALVESHDYKLAEIETAGNALRENIYKIFKRSLVLRSVDTGSCNACLQELTATQNTYYALSRYGIDFAASPRHADGIVVTGPVSINMQDALLKTYHAMSEPRLVIASGACAFDGGIFKEGYASPCKLSDLLPVDLVIPGCPPSPQAIIFGLLKLLDRIR